MRLRTSRTVAAVAAACAAVLAVGAYRFARSIDAERARAEDLGRVLVERTELAAPNLQGVALWLPDEPARDVEPFAGRVYVATSAGLAAYEPDGRLARRYTTLDGLPENSLTCLERFGDKLYVGTSSSGLLAFDGDRFTRYRFERPRATRVSALLAAGDELVVGTFDAGVFEFDGAAFTRRYAGALGEACAKVTALAAAGPRLYVGTHDAGLFEWREGAVSRFGTTEGLGSARVVGLAARGGAVVVATDLSVAEVAGGEVRTIDGTANATGVAVRNGQIYASTLTAGVALAGGPEPAEGGRAPAPPGAFSAGVPAKVAWGVKLEDGVLWAMTDRGLFACVSPDGTARFEAFGEPIGRSGLAAGHVAALGIDGRGRLLAGYFDGGVDALDRASGDVLERMDDPSLREVNALAPDPGGGRVWLASSKGVAGLDGGRRTVMLTPKNGLVGENATALCRVDGSGLAVATNKGLTVFDGAVARSLSAFQGLPSNHVYAVAESGGTLFAGTLAGLAAVDGMRVSRIYSTSNSGLPHNWVNALAAAEGRLFVGTYGGGVAALTPTGDVVPFEETAGLDVNPGAMLVSGGRLFVGTLDSGALVMDLGSGRWSRVTAGLASQNVTAIAADESYVYFGTENGITRAERSALP